MDGVSAFYNVTIPRNAPVKKRNALTEEQVRMIETYPHPMQLFTMIATFSGLRKSEVLALQWKHIDLEHNKIKVEQSLNWQPNSPVIKRGGKTANSVRVVVIPPVLVTYLRDYRNSLSAYPVASTIVVSNRKGGYYSKSSFRRAWNNYMRELNYHFGDFSNTDIQEVPADQLPMKIESFTSHQCRHFFATLCYLQGFTIGDTMSELGHANPATTMAIYTDLKNYSKADLSPEFQKKLLTVYQIPLRIEAPNHIELPG